ncbi:hypothetical protein LOC67_11510 [Stieleria sp. JC731]|uniref:hypothetical protein n=1 Tax=Pirellulaceae TaxID=2691357 RepID=UPI001E473928|nr:hypothetical protein [Stieleria sp. JC731]MCC9601173.1 hypothetical protein [Stieleria sp. JC731]
MFKKVILAVAVCASSLFLFQSDADAGNRYCGRARYSSGYSSARYSRAYTPSIQYRAPIYSVGRPYYSSPVYRSPYYGSYRYPYSGSYIGPGVGIGYSSFGPYRGRGVSIGIGF